MRRPAWPEFVRAVTRAGLLPQRSGGGHWQIGGGALLVKYYPDAKRGPTAYVAGTTAGFLASVKKAVAATHRVPHCRGRQDIRSASYRRVRENLLSLDPRCHWCGAPLTLATSTLDHIVPLVRGGLNNGNNFTLACRRCNLERGPDMPELRG